MKTEKEILDLCSGSVYSMIDAAEVDSTRMCKVSYAQLIELATMLSILQQD